MSIVPLATVVGAPRLLDVSGGVPPLTLLSDETVSVPPLTRVLPVNVFAPETAQLPAPLLVSDVVLVVLLSTMAPCTALAAVLVPARVRIFAPAPVAVKAL